LNCRTRCRCNPFARQIRCTEETLMPTALAITGFARRIAQCQAHRALAHRLWQRRDA
jgi:hypothetical protein